MAYERRWPTIILHPIIVSNYIITVNSTLGLHPKHQISLMKDGQRLLVEIKEILNSTQLKVGKTDSSIKGPFLNPIQFDGGTLFAFEQEKNKIQEEIISQATYEAEPTVAVRVIGITPLGNLSDTPEGNLDLVEPDTTFVYGEAKEVIQIRERAPSKFIHLNTCTFIASTKTIEFEEDLPDSIQMGAKCVIINGGGSNIYKLITIVSRTNSKVVVAENIDNYVGISQFDFSVGEKCKCTNFVYDDSYSVIKIYNTIDEVNREDIIGVE